MYRDRQGQEINLIEWGHLIEDHEYQFVKHDEVGRFSISTYWVGIDDSPYLCRIFETLVEDESEDKCKIHNMRINAQTEDKSILTHDMMKRICINYYRDIIKQNHEDHVKEK